MGFSYGFLLDFHMGFPLGLDLVFIDFGLGLGCVFLRFWVDYVGVFLLLSKRVK